MSGIHSLLGSEMEKRFATDAQITPLSLLLILSFSCMNAQAENG